MVCGADINFPHQRCCLNDLKYPKKPYHPLCLAINLVNKEMLDLVQKHPADAFNGLGCPLLTCVKSGNAVLFRELIQEVGGNTELDDVLFEALYWSEVDDLSNTIVSIIEDREIVPDPKILCLLWGSSHVSPIKTK
jgi:hypothetical protein